MQAFTPFSTLSHDGAKDYILQQRFGCHGKSGQICHGNTFGAAEGKIYKLVAYILTVAYICNK